MRLLPLARGTLLAQDGKAIAHFLLELHRIRLIQD